MKKNVLFVVPSLRRAGAETQVVDLVNGIDPIRFNKYLFTFEKELDQLERVDRSTVHALHALRRHKFDLSVPRMLARAIDAYEIDIVHCSLQFSLLMAWLARGFGKRRPPLVVALHKTVNRDLQQEVRDQLLYRWLFRSCPMIIFVCHSQRNFWCRKFSYLEARSTVVYNGVDLERFRREPHLDAGRQLRISLTIPDDAAVLSCIAGFRPEKGHQYLIQAFSGLPDNAYLLMAGEGEKRPGSERLVAEMGLQGRVKFLGNVVDVQPLLAASDLMVLASTAVETFSMAMLEAMSMEVPVLVPDIGGLSEAVEPGLTGELTQPGNVAMLGEKLATMLADPGRLLRMGVEARRRVAERFSIEQMVRETEERIIAVAG